MNIEKRSSWWKSPTIAARVSEQARPIPETPDGQAAFLEEVQRLVVATPHGLGKGIFWWEPAVTGGLERRGFFDPQYNVLPVISVFDRWVRH